MNEKYLPIGTVCLLKNGKKRVMITGFCVTGKEQPEKLFDYIGCLYPEGVISTDTNLLFDHIQIEKIDNMGFSDDEEKQFKIKLNELVKTNISQQSLGVQATPEPAQQAQVSPFDNVSTEGINSNNDVTGSSVNPFANNPAQPLSSNSNPTVDNQMPWMN